MNCGTVTVSEDGDDGDGIFGLDRRTILLVGAAGAAIALMND